jgi:hypothetical protein
MARMIRELIFGNNLLLALLASVALISTIVIFQLAANKKVGLLWEKWFAFFYIFVAPQVTLVPFNYLHLSNLGSTSGSNLSLIPWVFYPWVILVLSGRFISFFQKSICRSLIIFGFEKSWLFGVLFAANNIDAVVASSRYHAESRHSIYRFYDFYFLSRCAI